MPQRMLWQNTEIKRTIRFSEATINQIRQAAADKGCTSTEVVRQASSGSRRRQEGERRIASPPSRSGTTCRACTACSKLLFAFVETFSKPLADRFYLTIRLLQWPREKTEKR